MFGYNVIKERFGLYFCNIVNVNVVYVFLLLMGEWYLGLEKGFGKVFLICNVFVERYKKIKFYDLYFFYEVEVLKNIIIGGMNKCKFEL